MDIPSLAFSTRADRGHHPVRPAVPAQPTPDRHCSGSEERTVGTMPAVAPSSLRCPLPAWQDSSAARAGVVTPAGFQLTIIYSLYNKLVIQRAAACRTSIPPSLR